jgi:endo-1,4-beta-xylanase
MARTLQTTLLVASLLVSAGRPSAAQAQTEGLHSLFVAAGKLYFGTATETNNFNDAAYQAIATNKNEFGQYTPENSQKWEVTEPSQGGFVFTDADAVASHAKANGQLLRCHTLTWHSQLPSFGESALPPPPLPSSTSSQLTPPPQFLPPQGQPKTSRP